MANTATVVINGRDREQFQSAFEAMYFATATIADNDAVTAGDTATFSVSIPGAAVGDFVLVASSSDLSDGTDQAIMTGVVTAANTVGIRLQADAGAYAADDLNGTEVKIAVLRAKW